MIETYVIIPVKRGERGAMMIHLIEQLDAEPGKIFLDDGDDSVTRKWNRGLDWAAMASEGEPHNVAILNNDVEVCSGFLEKLADGLRCGPDVWLAYPGGYDGPSGVYVRSNLECAGQTMTGWAFMLRGEAGLRVDEQFEWWYADSDMEKQVRAAGKLVVSVGGCEAIHLDPLRSSLEPERLAMAKADEARFAAKWKLDPATLWLAMNSNFGKIVLTKS